MQQRQFCNRSLQLAIATAAGAALIVLARYGRPSPPARTAALPQSSEPVPVAIPVPVPAGGEDVARPTWSQARATWFSGVIAALALCIAAGAFLGQAKINSQQVQLNRYAEDRIERIYSSRVALWAVIGSRTTSVLPAGLDVQIQNRSPVPILDVSIVASLVQASGPAIPGRVQLGSVPPCTISSVRIAPPDGWALRKTPDAWLGYQDLSLLFSAAGRRWSLTPGGLDPATDAVPTTVPDLIVVPLGQKPADTCGEAA